MRLFRQIIARSLPAAMVMAIAVVFGCALAHAAPTSRPGDVGLAEVRFGGDSTVTRVVLDLDASVAGRIVSDESTAGRLVIALPTLLSTGPLEGPGKGLVTAWSIRDAASGARLVLETAPGATIARKFVLPPAADGGPWRYVIDIRGAADDPLAPLLDHGAPRLAAVSSPATVAGAEPPPATPVARPAVLAAATPAAGPSSATAASSPSPHAYRYAATSSPSAPQTSASAAAPAPRYSEVAPWSPTPVMAMAAMSSSPAPRAAPVPVRTTVAMVRPATPRAGAERGMKVIVIDAGHGGHDTGAQSLVRNEKDITLAAALSLRAHLLKMGHYRVVMTRDQDVFIPLETRVQIARQAGADLFISLHADSAGSDPTPHGASVYTLSDSGQTRVNNVLGPHEWFSRVGDGGAGVRQILLDLTQRSTRNRSSEFASKLLAHIGDKVDLLPRSHRDAGYFVLLAPDVPAVLLEMGFITNPGDEMRLTDPAQREKLTGAIADAIDDYFYGGTRLEAGF